MKLPTKKSVGVSISPLPWVELGAPKIDIFEIMHWNENVDSL